MALDNANPTILNVAELSSQRERRRNKKKAIKDVSSVDFLLSRPVDSLYTSDVSEDDSEDSRPEPIDEEELYGKFGHLLLCPNFCVFKANYYSISLASYVLRTRSFVSGTNSRYMYSMFLASISHSLLEELL